MAKNVGKWVDADERLPEQGVYVLIRRETDWCYIACLKEHDGGRFWEDQYGIYHRLDSVTHWSKISTP